MSEWGYISIAYVVTWTTVGAYVVYLLRRRARAQGEWRRVAGKGGDA